MTQALLAKSIATLPALHGHLIVGHLLDEVGQLLRRHVGIGRCVGHAHGRVGRIGVTGRLQAPEMLHQPPVVTAQHGSHARVLANLMQENTRCVLRGDLVSNKVHRSVRVGGPYNRAGINAATRITQIRQFCSGTDDVQTLLAHEGRNRLLAEMLGQNGSQDAGCGAGNRLLRLIQPVSRGARPEMTLQRLIESAPLFDLVARRDSCKGRKLCQVRQHVILDLLFSQTVNQPQVGCLLQRIAGG